MKKSTILVVEDESIVAHDIQNMLLSLNYDVVGVTTRAKEAVNIAKKKNPSLVLMDIMLQGTSGGVKAADVIYKKHNIPVVYLTSYTDETTLQLAKETAPFGYLLKPFEERELQTTIEIALYKFKMEQELKKREQWLFTMLESIADGVIATDDKGNTTFMNPKAESLTGWKQMDALNSPLEKIFLVRDEKSGKRFNRLLQPVLEAKETDVFSEAILISKNGNKTPIEFRIAPIKQEENRISGTILAFSNISRRKIAEEKLIESWEKQKRTMQGTMDAMAFTIEKRDPYTAGHQHRVTKLAVAIAERFGFTKDRIEGLKMAGELHDIGKIYIPAEILSKPGNITDVEFNIIKTHPKVGYDILKSIEFPWPIQEFVLQHHERMDGSGYPDGLKGNDIHLEARILAVADVIEAMVSHRPYRPALPIQQAIDEIKHNQGILYDKKVVDACLDILMNGNFTFD
jgi:PAS domain S-box-containing protein/putative nucleotidyltransferase with HDIG domain